MDNAIVGTTGLLCYILAQVSTEWYENITPLAIVAFVVYYFLAKFDKYFVKFDKRLDEISVTVNDIDKRTKHIEGDENHDRQ